MSLNDDPKCPDGHRSVHPHRPSDTQRSLGANNDADPYQWGLKKIIQSALDLGASDAAVIPSADILVADDLANLCDGDPRCENYGLAPSCPPHVSGPSGFRKLQTQSRQTIVVRLDVPSSALFSNQRWEIMQLLHEIVSGVEQVAVKTGFKGTLSLAGGSCKKIFCHDHPDCQRLSEQAQCRHPESARPSMSGFGINVAELFRSVGWNLKAANQEDVATSESMTWVAGIIVIRRHQTTPLDLR